MLGWQVPGRRFWSWWCGGLSLGELLFFLGVLGVPMFSMYEHPH